MSALYKLQQSFAADLWDERLNRLDGIILDGGLPAERLFQVYRNNFWISVEEALAEIYGVVERLVGRRFFTFMTDRFLRSYPLRHGNLHQLGGELPAFLKGFKPAAGLPYLPDIARLEWAYNQVFHAADAVPFNPQLLVGLPPAKILQLHFDLASCSRLVYSPFPIFHIWRVNQEGYAGDQQVDLAAGSASVLVTRPALEVELQQLDQGDAGFLQSLTAGCNLGEATEAAVNNSNDFDLGAALARYLVSGVLVPGHKVPIHAANYSGGKQA